MQIQRRLDDSRSRWEIAAELTVSSSLFPLVVFVVYLGLQLFVLPRLGVST